MPASRRRFLLASSLITFGLGTSFVVSNRGKNGGVSDKSTLGTLSSIIDTIIPSAVTSDNQKGALDLKIDDSIQEIAARKPKFRDQVTRLIAGIEKVALADRKSGFVNLNIDDREALLTKLLTQNKLLQLRRDLQILRKSVMNLYYTSAHGHAHLGYVLPSNYPNY